MLLILWINMIQFINISLGSGKKHSTQHAIITLVEKITSSLDSGDIIIGVYLDLKKTFDTVNRHILFKKLSLIWHMTYHSKMA